MSINNPELAKLRIRIQSLAIKHEEWQCCTNCIEFTTTTSKPVQNLDGTTDYIATGPKCMKYGVLPPPDVLVVGCEEHDWYIPF